MAILTSSQQTFVDITDQRKLSAYITSNLPKSQIEDPNVLPHTYAPDWASTPLVLTPVVFLVISDGNVRVLSVDSAPQSPAERIFESLPQLIDKAESFLASRTPKKEEELTEE